MLPPGCISSRSTALLLQLRPNFADAWSNLASAYMRKGRMSDAAQCCRQALAINPRLVTFVLVLQIIVIWIWGMAR